MYEVKFRPDDDYVDRLSRQYTVLTLICFSFLVSTKQFVGMPISCWCPAQFTDSHREYTNTVCWVRWYCLLLPVYCNNNGLPVHEISTPYTAY